MTDPLHLSERLRCFLFHRWSPWMDTNGYSMHPPRGDVEKVIGLFIVQRRRCERCGKLQARRVHL